MNQPPKRKDRPGPSSASGRGILFGLRGPQGSGLLLIIIIIVVIIVVVIVVVIVWVIIIIIIIVIIIVGFDTKDRLGALEIGSACRQE